MAVVVPADPPLAGRNVLYSGGTILNVGYPVPINHYAREESFVPNDLQIHTQYCRDNLNNVPLATLLYEHLHTILMRITDTFVSFY